MVAALTALLMTGLEKRLHRGLAAEPGGTPPLLTLERYLFRLIAIGFGLLTLALASGALFSEEVFGKPFTFSHKSLFSILAWLTFGALLSRRHEYQADRYAAENASARDLVSALIKLYRDNAATLTPDPLHSMFYDSHPPAVARIARLQQA